MSEPVQGSDAWRQLRCGWIGASKIADVMAKGKSGAPSATRANLMADLICERLTGQPVQSFTSSDMQWGIDNEQGAVDAYEFLNDVEVQTCSFIPHPTIEFTGASPDRLIGTDGLLEVKCFKTANHIDTLLTESIDRRYLLQIQWQLACTQRSWAHFVAYDPRLPATMQLFQKTVPRDERLIAEISVEVRAFIAELNEKTLALQAKYLPQKDAA